MPTDPSLLTAQIRAELERIAQSRWFRDSSKLQDFLRFAVEESLAGRAGEVKETTVATEVFHRRPDFDPRTDSIVRVQATTLRKKLAAYYESDGAGSLLRIELPRGHYVPVFRAVQAEPMRPHRPLWTILAAASVALVTTGLCLFYFANQRKPGFAWWKKFFEPGSKTILVCGTPQFFSFNGLQIRDIDVNSQADLTPDSRLLSLYRSVSATPSGAPAPSLTYTGIGEARSLELISHFFWEHSRHPAIRLFSEIGPREFADANLVIIASLRFQSFIRELGFPADFVRARNAGPGETIRNLHPRSGEQREYVTSRNPANDASVEYAIISLFSSRNSAHRTMLIGGTTTYATEAAAQFVTEITMLQELDTIAGKASARPVYECLLRVYQRGSSVVKSELVAHHE
jgi:hypothetical protein